MIKSIGTYKKVLFFCSEGMPYIAAGLLLAIVVTTAAYCRPHVILIVLAVLTWLLAIEIGYFFRDPQRVPPQQPGVIVAPADGKIIEMQATNEEDFIQGDCTRVSIFMNVFNVHVNRAPIGGAISYMRYNPGKFFSAFREKASLDNEQVSLGFTGHHNGNDLKVMVKLIAGLIARRIVVWRDTNEEVARGDRISLIRFGSRADVFLPTGTDVAVKVGDRVTAGETVIGRIK